MIDKITMKEFRSHADTELPLVKPITFIGGVNGAGKSSIRQAAQIALLGFCEGTDRRGSGKTELPRKGKKDFRVIIECGDGISGEQGPHTLEVGQTTAIGLGATKISDLKDVVPAHFGASRDAIEVVTGGSYFDLDEKIQRNLLMGIAGVDLTPEKIKEYISGKVGESFSTIESSLSKIPGSVEGVEFTERVLTELRKSAKKELSEAEDAVMALAEASGPIGDDPEKSKDIGAKLRNELATIQEELGKLRADNTGSSERLTAARKELDDITNKIEATKPPKDIDKAIKEAEAKAKKAKEELAGLQSKLTTLQAEGKGHENTVSRFQKFKGDDEMPCPTCGQMVHAETVARHLEEAETAIERLLEEVKTIKDGMGKATEEYQKHMDRHVALMKCNLELLPRQQSLTEEIERLERRVPSEETAARLKQLEQDASDKQDELDQWTTEFGETVGRDRDLKNANDRVKKLQPHVATLESAVDAIRQFRTDAVAEKIDAFEDKINKGGSVFGMNFTVDRETLTVSLSSGIEYRFLSESEKIRVDTIFRSLIAHATGLGFIIIDRVDVLDEDNRRSLMKLLVVSKVKALVLAKYDNREAYSPSSHEAVDYWWVYRNTKGESTLEKVA